MLYFNACPRCVTGTIEGVDEWDGYCFLCLNCGFVLEVPSAAASELRYPVEPRENLKSVG